MKKILLISACSVLAIMVLTESRFAQGNCEDRTKSFKNISLRILASSYSGCYIKYDQEYNLLKINKNRNRSLSFFGDGRIMVFIGTDDYEFMSKSTGSRSYHLLPFKKTVLPEYDAPESDEISVMLPSGYKALFSSEKGELVSIDGFSVAVKPIEHFDIMVKNGGGIEIRPEKGNIVIDYGWRTGGMSISHLFRTSVIYDSQGNSCQVKNSDLYMVDPRDSDEVVFRIKNNAELDKFLKLKCPAVKMDIK